LNGPVFEKYSKNHHQLPSREKASRPGAWQQSYEPLQKSGKFFGPSPGFKEMEGKMKREKRSDFTFRLLWHLEERDHFGLYSLGQSESFQDFGRVCQSRLQKGLERLSAVI